MGAGDPFMAPEAMATVAQSRSVSDSEEEACEQMTQREVLHSRRR